MQESCRSVGIALNATQAALLVAAYQTVDADPTIPDHEKAKRKADLLADAASATLSAVDARYGEDFRKAWERRMSGGTPPGGGTGADGETADGAAGAAAEEPLFPGLSDAEIDEAISSVVVEEPEPATPGAETPTLEPEAPVVPPTEEASGGGRSRGASPTTIRCRRGQAVAARGSGPGEVGHGPGGPCRATPADPGRAGGAQRPRATASHGR